ncbi:MAG: type transport system permease protein [Pseudonocardiales bacterium]|jgi:ABC-type transport system involved in multi-copper enzyme maturation permease subunit|nr:type transport system permease protein [Pseudonocardiales bacterium]
MTATIPTDAPLLRAQPTTIGFGNLLRSEWTKLRSVRSTYWTAGIAVLASVALGVAICARTAYNINRGQQSVNGFDPTLTSLNGLYIAQVAIGALGVLTISSEYGTGMIRATLSVVPQRRAMLAAKGLVFAVFALIAGEIMSFTAYGIGQALLSNAHAGASLSQPGVLRATIGGGLYLTAVGLLGFGFGALIRHTAGALSAFFGTLFALTVVADLLPTSWRNDVINYLPANAGSQILTVLPTARALPPWTGLGVLSLYALATITAASALITRRDA